MTLYYCIFLILAIPALIAGQIAGWINTDQSANIIIGLAIGLLVSILIDLIRTRNNQDDDG
ncbi:hypothetical protein A2863_02000 [Candidatus Woesebacteria bacterium RIFCSPHIGHO2_01_FULL_38_9b]|uniref:Uncharacterized protein n=1 Tax=Candidatus Woesebacteria bacterium RIFCSPHIGHO2_01_FULL_38_9b TaxID=1802493 RepID=A0A1F7XYG6_9BACT|nr:MAG: hypothetical protein A2863_02000 [Candidatus Woesebacteria bacterium RIFCSPHIGHO2_01_FULL_38_9b]